MRIARLEMEARLNSDTVVAAKIQAEIAKIRADTKLKTAEIDKSSKTRDQLSIKFQELLDIRRALEKKLKELRLKLAQRQKLEEEQKLSYEASLKSSTRQREIELEIQKYKKLIAEEDAKIRIVTNQIEDLDDEILTITEKITLKIRINTQRKNADKQVEYIPDKTDPLDVKIAQYINVDDTRVPIKKLERGIYMFGRREIKASQDASYKGGYKVMFVGTRETLGIDDLLSSYAEKEIKELSKMREDQEMVIEKKGDQVGEASPVTLRGKAEVVSF